MSCQVLITGHWIRVNVNVPSRGVTRCHVLVTRHAALTPPQVSTAAADESETSPLCAGMQQQQRRAGAGYIIAHSGQTLPNTVTARCRLLAPGCWPPPLFAATEITEQQQPAAKISDTELGGAGAASRNSLHGPDT